MNDTGSTEIAVIDERTIRDKIYMVRLIGSEMEELSRCKKFTSIQTKGVKGGRSNLPYAFTEQGIYMLMTVLLQIMRR